MTVNMLHEFGLLIGRARDKDGAGVANRLGDCLKEGVILRRVPTADCIGLMVNMPGRVMWMKNHFVDLGPVEIKDASLMMIDPDNSMVGLAQKASSCGTKVRAAYTKRGAIKPVSRPTLVCSNHQFNKVQGLAPIVPSCSAHTRTGLQPAVGERVGPTGHESMTIREGSPHLVTGHLHLSLGGFLIRAGRLGNRAGRNELCVQLGEALDLSCQPIRQSLLRFTGSFQHLQLQFRKLFDPLRSPRRKLRGKASVSPAAVFSVRSAVQWS